MEQWSEGEFSATVLRRGYASGRIRYLTIVFPLSRLQFHPGLQGNLAGRLSAILNGRINLVSNRRSNGYRSECPNYSLVRLLY